MRWVLLLGLLLMAGPAQAVEYWVDCENGSDSNSCTSKGAACGTLAGAMGKASCGDVVTQVSGTTCYPTGSVGLTISGKSCSAGSPFEFRCEVEPATLPNGVPDKSTCVLSGLGEWTDGDGNTGVDYAQLGTAPGDPGALWEVFDASRNLYRTTSGGFANGSGYWVFFRNDSIRTGEITSGIQYNDMRWIDTTNPPTDTDGNGVPEDQQHGTYPAERSRVFRYDGPGNYVSGGRLYMRMMRPWLLSTANWDGWHFNQDLVPGKNSLATDGAQMFIFRESSRGVRFTSSADYVTWNGIDIEHYGRTIDVQAGANNNTIKNMEHGVSGRYPGYIQGDGLTLDNVICDRHLPVYLTREAVKVSPSGGSRLSNHQGDCWHSDRRTNNVTVKNSYCVDSFDCLVHSGGADNHMYDNNVHIRMRDDTQQNKYLGSFTLKDNICYGCYGFFGPYTSYGDNGPHYLYGNWVDTSFLVQVGGPLAGLPLRFTNTCVGCGGRANTAINPRGAAVADDGRLSGRFCQTHGGSSTQLKMYGNTVIHRGDWYGRATGCGVADMRGNNATDRKTEYINNIWLGTGNGTALLDDAVACTQFFDHNIYWRGSGVSETSQSCSSVNCLFDGHPGGGMTWERWCGAGSAGGVCGPWNSTADGNAGRNTNCSGSPSGFNGDWDVGSKNQDPQLNAITNFDHLADWRTTTCFVGQDGCPDGRPIEGGNATTGGAAIPAIWPDNDRYVADGFIGALEPGSGTPVPPPSTWEMQFSNVTPPSCTVGVDCGVGAFDLSAQAQGTSGNWSFEIDCLRGVSWEPEVPNPLASCTGSGTVADCNVNAICDYSATGAGVYNVEIRSTNSTTGLTASSIETFTVYDDTPTQDVFPNFTSSKGDSQSNCEASETIAALNDANNLPANELTDGWYNDTCADLTPSPQGSGCCMQGSWTGGAACNTGDNRLDLRGAVAPAEVPKGDQSVLLRVRSCDAVPKTISVGFWDTATNDWFCKQDFPGIDDQWQTLEFVTPWELCGDMHLQHPDGGGLNIAYQCFGCDAVSLAWRAAVEDPGGGTEPPPPPPTLEFQGATNSGSISIQ